MCGITGWIDFQVDLTEQKDILLSMSKKLAPRGPDAKGEWMSPYALIAHRRLSVVDPEGGKQPMIRSCGDDTFVISYNGELYNTMDLRRKLESKGYVFYTDSDTEVLLVSYMEWGPECVDHLNGIYAFVVWDDLKRLLFAARDRFGVKPFFFSQRGSSLIFGSELKALLANPLVKPEITMEGLSEIFALSPAKTPGHGIFKNVHELPPAHYMIYNTNGLKIKRYWQLKSYTHEDDLNTTVEKVNELVIDAFKRQLVSDVPLCTFLSGGLDSSAITANTANVFKRSGHKLNTYSIDYTDNDLYFKSNAYQPSLDSPWVKKMSKFFNTEHHYIKVDTLQLVKALEDSVHAKDLPGMADIESSLLLFCREVKKGATVALSGECADEIFGGYPWFYRNDLLNCGTFPWAKDYGTRLSVLSPELKESIDIKKYIDRRYRETLDEIPKLKGENSIEARRREIFYLNITWFMTTLLDRKDRMSMAEGLEVRVPYCDHRLVQYLWNIPWDMKMLEGYEKGLLRKALEGLLPNDVLYRKKSPYPKTHNPSYEKAVSRWLLEILNTRNSPVIPLIDADTVRSLAEKTSDYGSPWFGQLMAMPQMFAFLIQVDIWLRKYKIRIV